MTSNLTKVWLFILGTAFLILVLGYQLGGRLGLLAAFGVTLALNVLIFFFGDQKIISELKAQQIQGQDPFGTLEIVRAIAQKLKMPTPKVYLFESNLPTSFTVGHSWQRPSLGLSESLLKKLNTQEIECVVAHQLCRIKRWDSFSYSVTSTLANTLLGLGQFIDRFLPFQVLTVLLTPLSWIVIKMIVRDKNIFINDQEASKVLSDRFLLGRTLWKLQGYAENNPLQISPCLGHLFIVDPQASSQKNFFTSFHPKIQTRLSRLMGYYPP